MLTDREMNTICTMLDLMRSDMIHNGKKQVAVVDVKELLEQFTIDDNDCKHEGNEL